MLYVNISHLGWGGHAAAWDAMADRAYALLTSTSRVFDALTAHAHKFLTSADGADSTYAVKPDPVQVCFETAHPVTAARPVMFGDELQAEPHPGIPGLEVIVYYGGDGALVVQIDTKEIDMISRHGRLRVNLNDDQIYDGDPDTDTPPGCPSFGGFAARHTQAHHAVPRDERQAIEELGGAGRSGAARG